MNKTPLIQPAAIVLQAREVCRLARTVWDVYRREVDKVKELQSVLRTPRMLIAAVLCLLLSVWGAFAIFWSFGPPPHGILDVLFWLTPLLSLPLFLLTMLSLRLASRVFWGYLAVNYLVLIFWNWQQCAGGACGVAGPVRVLVGSFLSGPQLPILLLVATLLQQTLSRIGREERLESVRRIYTQRKAGRPFSPPMRDSSSRER